MLLDVLREMPGIVEKLGLEVNELPHFTTVCTRKQDLKMPIWRFLLRCSTELYETGDVQAIDSTGYDRHAASQHYANRTDYTFRAVKTTALVDCETSVILDIHCSMKQPNDTKVGWKVLTRNLERMTILAADKGFDWNDLRDELRENGVRPVIKHREHWSLDAAHNARIDDEIYHQRSNIESVFFALRREFGETLRARTWFGQFRELILKAAVRNVKLGL